MGYVQAGSVKQPPRDIDVIGGERVCAPSPVPTRAPASPRRLDPAAAEAELNAARMQVEQARQNVAREREDAQRKGYAEGFSEGRKAGLGKAREEIAAQLADERDDIAAMVKTLTDPWKTLRADLAEAITGAAVEVARAVVGQVQGADTAALKRVVDEILVESARVGGSGNTLRIRANPKNAALVLEWAGAAGAEVVADEKLGPADVRAELTRGDGDPADRIDWDATLESRWKAIRQALGLAA